MNILVIGKPKYQKTLVFDKFIREGSINGVLEKYEMTGGASVYVAALLTKWGLKVEYAGAVCEDDIGNKIKNEFENLGINTRLLENNYENHSGMRYILLSKENSKTTEIFDPDNAYVTKYKYDFEPDIIITDGTDINGAMAASNNYPNAKMIMLANKVNDEYYQLTKRCSYVCASSHFASVLSKTAFELKPKVLVNMMQTIKDLNKAAYTVMLHNNGVMYISGKDVKKLSSKIKEVVDDSNYESAFFAGYVYGLIKGYDADSIAKIADGTAALAITKIGSLTSIPALDDVFSLVQVKKVGEYAKSEVNETSK